MVARAKKISAVLGLGNPGRRYSKNRHNVGYMVVDRLAFLKKEEFARGDGPFVYCQIGLSSGSLILGKATTYMNNTGKASLSLLKYFRLEPADLLVVSDDCNLPPGKIRFRSGGSDGGHNGLMSIIRFLETRDFPRLRLGIGMNPEPVPLEDYVLSDYETDELPVLERMLAAAGDYIIDLAEGKSVITSQTLSVNDE